MTMKPIHASAILVVVITIFVGVSQTMDSHQEKCTVLEGTEFKVDSCDAKKFLSCQSGRCLCNDVANLIFDFRYVEDNSLSRSRRSPMKKGGGGGSTKDKIGAGLAGGAIGALGGYQLGKAVANPGNNNNNNGNYNGTLMKERKVA
jgi:hypothetical protein